MVADIFDALAADRPYRAAMPIEKVFTILHTDAPALSTLIASKRSNVSCDPTFRDMGSLQAQLELWSGLSRQNQPSDAVTHA